MANVEPRPVTCTCGRMRLPGREQCDVHNGAWDDEMTQALERLDEQHKSAKALSDVYLANADRGDDEANDELLAEMLRRMKALGPPLR